MVVMEKDLKNSINEKCPICHSSYEIMQISKLKENNAYLIFNECSSCHSFCRFRIVDTINEVIDLLKEEIKSKIEINKEINNIVSETQTKTKSEREENIKQEVCVFNEQEKEVFEMEDEMREEKEEKVSDDIIEVGKQLGYTEEQIQEILEQREVLETFKVPPVPEGATEGEKVFCRFVDNKVKTIATKYGDRHAVTVRDENGVRYTLWLTTESVMREYLRMRNELGDLTGKKIAVYRRVYTHPKYGKKIATTIQYIPE